MATKTGATATVIEHDGKLWKPKPGATATAEEFVAARTLMVEIHRDARWNPWVSDDRAAELEAAMETFEQWTRAEPGFRPKTERQVDAWMARDGPGVRGRTKAPGTRAGSATRSATTLSGNKPDWHSWKTARPSTASLPS